jgi:DNA repair exonuclease SbcCD ATPase subunit
VNAQLREVKKQVDNFDKLLSKLERIHDKPSKAHEAQDIAREIESVKATYFARKQACKSALAGLTGAKKVNKELEFKQFTNEYKRLNQEFKALGVQAQRSELMEGAGAGLGADFDPRTGTNSQVLSEAARITDRATEQLRGAARQVEESKQIGKAITETLEADREKITKTRKNLERMNEEMDTANKLLTRFIKKLYTDKIIIAFTFIIVLAILGIIIYSSVDPKQKTFDVPDAAKPPSPNEVGGRRLLRGVLATHG